MTVRLIKKINKKKINNLKGQIFKYISKKDRYYREFGEVYFNEIKKNHTKGWNLHKKNFCLIYCIQGKVLFHFVDCKNKEKKILLSARDSSILEIPPKIWFSFKALNQSAIIVNFLNKPHKDSEVLKKNKIKNYFIK